MLGGDDKHVFAKDGPTHMIGTEIDWDNEEHRRCITACLVKGTYVLERDRTSRKEDTPRALAPAWWESFHFRRQCDYELECDCAFCRKGFIYGAVFKYAPPSRNAHYHPSSAPSYVVAFRGTMAGDPAGPSDMRNNFSILFNKQHSCPRFCHARRMVETLVVGEGAGAVWLAGHSLGASIALDVGRYMVTDKGLNLQTFLFNPPHVSLAPVIGEEARSVVYTVGDFGRSILGKVFPDHRNRMEALFQRLAPWVPNLYVNPNDSICEGFIAYFERREQQHPRLASTPYMSYRDVVFSRESERSHLLPSAKLWKNKSVEHGGHRLRQWWQPQGSEVLVLSPTPKLYTWP